MLGLALGLLCAPASGWAAGAATHPAGVRVVVDCATPALPPLSKHLFGVYQTPFWFKDHPPAAHDVTALLREAGVHDLRYELGWGKPDVFAPNMVGGAAGSLRVDFSAIDPFLRQLAEADVAPLLVLGYDPTPLQRLPVDWQRWKDAPGDLPAWGRACGQFAAHVEAIPGIGEVSDEVWNEPDLPGDGGKVFFNGTPADYGLLYGATADAVIAATRHRARVGGPAIAYDRRYLTQSGILTRPIDFVSVHAYANAPAQLAAVRSALAGRAIPLELTEYASFGTDALSQNTHFAAASAFFSDVERFLAEPGLQKVYWAQWVDRSMGMLDDDLHRRALFNAYSIYQTMIPTRRVAVTGDTGSGEIHTMAASDVHTAGLVLWNTGRDDHGVAAEFEHLPFAAATIEVFRIDAHHASYEDDPQHERLEPSERRWAPPAPSVTWAGQVPARGVVYLSVRPDGTAPQE